MRSFISGIIDCVALPSTSDTPVRVLRKCNSDNACCTEATESNSPLDASDHSSASSVFPNPIESEVVPSPITSVLTAEGIIDDDDTRHDVDDDVDEEEEDFLGSSIGSCRSHRSIDDGTARIFEEAFAEFLWSNPAFSSMSYMTLTRLRERLYRQSAKNVKVEAELRMQLEKLKESNRRTELMLQRELSAGSNLKSLREVELLKHIQESRDDRCDVGRYRSSMLTNPTGSMVSPSYDGYSPRYQLSMNSPHHWEMPNEEEIYREGIRNSKMEQAHMIAEMEKIKQEKMKREMSAMMENVQL